MYKGRRVITLKNLVKLQGVFAIMSLAYLFISLWRQQTMGEALSAAAIVPSILMFIVYLGCLLFPRLDQVKLYRVAMVLAILLFGGGGVIGNVMRYFDSGLADYASFTAWAIAVMINTFGTVLNTIAVFGLYKHGKVEGE